jgi:hypothetical protein
MLINPMKNILITIILLSMVTGCSRPEAGFTTVGQFYEKTKYIDISELLHVEFFIRGEKEVWMKYIDTTEVRWVYNLDTDSFRIGGHQNKLSESEEIKIAFDEMKRLRKLKEDLKLIGISQSPWPGEFVKFYLTPHDVAIYKPENCIIDEDAKNYWLAEFNQGIKLSPNWVYFNLDWDELDSEQVEKHKSKILSRIEGQ